MAKRDKEGPKGYPKNGKNGKNSKEKSKDTVLSSWTKRWIKAILLFLVAVIVVLSFPTFDKAGYAGQIFAKVCDFLIGKAFYTIPIFFFVAGLIFLKTRKKGKNLAMALAVLVSIIGVAGILAVKDLTQNGGGFIGYWLAKLFVGLFGILVANIIFGAILLIGLFIFLQFIWSELPKMVKEDKPTFAVHGQTDGPEGYPVKIKGMEAEKDSKQEKSKLAPAKLTLFKKEMKSQKKQILKKHLAKTRAIMFCRL